MKRYLVLTLSGLIAGCASAYQGVGSEVWYKNRMEEIESSFNKGEVSKAEYLRLKNEADAIRAGYTESRRPNTGVGFSYGVFR
jgi:hypothetical protein